MHEIVIDQFERYLSGEASQEFHDHLALCADCRAEVARLEDLSGLLEELKPLPELAEADFQPSPGFYNRLAYQIVETQERRSWGFFSPGVIFFRRIAFASLLLLASLGSFLVTREAEADGADAVTIMAQHDTSAAHTESTDRDRLLVTLASYRE